MHLQDTDWEYDIICICSFLLPIMSENLQRLFPAQAFSEQTRETTFNYILRKLATYRNRAEIYASAEEDTDHADFKIVLNQWAQDLLQHAWVVCDCPGGGSYSSSGCSCVMLNWVFHRRKGRLP